MSRSSTSSSDDTPHPAVELVPGRADPVAITSPDVVAPGRRRIVAAIATGCFLLVVFGHALIDLFAPVPRPTLLGAELAADQRERANARFGDGSLARLVEADLRQASRVRRFGLSFYGPLLLRWFGEAGSRFACGKDGFLFLRERIAVANVPRDEVVARATGRLTALARHLARLGTRTLFVPVPRKCVVMADELPTGVDPHADYDRALLDAMQRAGLATVDLLAAFAGAQEDAPYLTIDSHWSATGMLLAARATAAAALPGTALREPLLRKVTDVEYDRATAARLLGFAASAAARMPRSPLLLYRLQDPRAADVVFAPPPSGELPTTLVGTSFSRGGDEVNTFFVEALAAFSGLQLWNAALPGYDTLDALAAMLRDADHRLPPLLVLEHPVNQLVCDAGPLRGLGKVFAELPASERLVSLHTGAADRFSLPPFTVPPIAAARGEHELATSPASLVVPRDGTVLLRVRGRAAGDVAVSVDAGHDTITAPWRPGRDELLVPFAGSGLCAAPLPTLRTFTDDARCTVDSVELVCDLDLAHGVAGMPHDAAAGADGWRIACDFAALPAAIACVGIVLRGADASARHAVAAEFADGSRAQLLGPMRLRADAWLLLPLPLPATAGPLRRIVVHGAGAPPSAPLRAFALARLPR